MNVKEGDNILDVGCGTGAQTLPFLEKAGSSGHVCALDISSESIDELRSKAGMASNLTAITADMADLESVITSQCDERQFDIAHSSYALYYCLDREAVLDSMRRNLKSGGKLVIFTPHHPHGMVEFARKVSEIPAPVDECFHFGPCVLDPYFRKHLRDVSVHFFSNRLEIPSTADVMSFYESTTYYDHSVADAFRELVNEEIRKHGVFRFEKNGYLILGIAP